MDILNQTVEQIKIGYTWGIGLYSIMPFILSMAVILFGIYFICNNDWNINKLFSFILVICIFIVGIGGLLAAIHAKPVYKEVNQYEVTIDSSASFHSIHDNYDIVG